MPEFIVPVSERAKLLGFVPSPPDPRDYSFDSHADVPRALTMLPLSRVPWTGAKFPIYDQKGQSCVGNSSALGATIDQRRDVRRTFLYDAEELYAECKKNDGIPDVDGTFPRVAFKIRQDRGIKRANSSGQLDKVQSYAAVKTIEQIKVAIFLYGSCLLGSTWYDEWFDTPASLVLQEPKNPAGGHAYQAIGWSKKREALLLQNSWLRRWGGKIGGTYGRAWLPTKYVDWSDFEAWRAVDAPQP